eukprot:CAMPEP_0170746432 /NCGR_PEP_ID=MMETSP0437-20130122/8807_1 /TAXON_ID=0 /ORGANISM="Sexangularia sp." /LENGTH=178 /DNA_ID=CAMNT_0011085185 /DNA_START=59 /DNA_END=592 /DNA_ORIENTATION=+
MAKKRLYCDYCDAFLRSNSAKVRKSHEKGRNHCEEVRRRWISIREGVERRRNRIRQVEAKRAITAQVEATRQARSAEVDRRGGVPLPKLVVEQATSRVRAAKRVAVPPTVRSPQMYPQQQQQQQQAQVVPQYQVRPPVAAQGAVVVAAQQAARHAAHLAPPPSLGLPQHFAPPPPLVG